jgi:hypothetical protein
MLAKQVHDIDVLGAVGRPTGDEDEWLACPCLPVGELYAIACLEGIDLEVLKIGQSGRESVNSVWEGVIRAEDFDWRRSERLIDARQKANNRKSPQDELLHLFHRYSIRISLNCSLLDAGELAAGFKRNNPFTTPAWPRLLQLWLWWRQVAHSSQFYGLCPVHRSFIAMSGFSD